MNISFIPGNMCFSVFFDDGTILLDFDVEFCCRIGLADDWIGVFLLEGFLLLLWFVALLPTTLSLPDRLSSSSGIEFFFDVDFFRFEDPEFTFSKYISFDYFFSQKTRKQNTKNSQNIPILLVFSVLCDLLLLMLVEEEDFGDCGRGSSFGWAFTPFVSTVLEPLLAISALLEIKPDAFSKCWTRLSMCFVLAFMILFFFIRKALSSSSSVPSFLILSAAIILSPEFTSFPPYKHKPLKIHN